MILNAYAVLDMFLVLGRFFLAVLVIGLVIAGWRWRGSSVSPEAGGVAEDRFYLLFLLGFLLLGFNIASWPLFYLLLQSYVPEWPGAMCIYGVTQVGAGSIGIARFLPRLVTTLQWTKPGLIFLTGAWFVLYLLNRRTETAPLMNRMLAVIAMLGVVAAADATVEAAYLTIPKREAFPSAGCCTAAFDSASHAVQFLPQAMRRESFRPWLHAAYYAVNAGMILGLGMATLRAYTRPLAPWLAALLVGTLIVWPVSAVFWIEIAAPALLHLPYHHCLYDLVPNAPEGVAAIVLAVLGSFSVGWACVAGWFGNCEETRPFLIHAVRKLLQLGLAGYLGSVALFTIAFWRVDLSAGCALDGVAVNPTLRVRIVDTESKSYEFCCIRCAEYWREHRRQEPVTVYLTDERTGQEIDLASAQFVRSSVTTTPASGNRIHVFQNSSDAQSHAARFGGTVLQGSDRPFTAYR